MKRNIFVKGLAALLVAAGLSACSEDYLQTYPETTIDASTVQTTEKGAQAALYGLCRAMYTQYADLQDYSSFNGESWVSMFYGEVFGEDYFSLIWASRMGTNYMWMNNTNYQGWVSAFAWRYYYNLIYQANVILEGIDNIDGDVNNLKLIKAQALTIRSFAYVRLLQIYGPRWSDSAKGTHKAIVIREKPTNDEVPLASVNDVLTLVYKNLDDAIALYNESTSRRKYLWEPNLNVAQGIYARAALLKEDWPTAQKMAHDARQGVPVMTEAQFLGGFAEANDEYMWCNAAEVEGIYYWAHGSWYACQGPYPTLWGLGAGAINYDLYKQIPKGDVRASQFFTPDKPLRQPLRPASFWNKTICNPADMNLNKNSNMRISIQAFGNKLIPDGDVAKWGEPYVARESGGEDDIRICFGAQYKFWCIDTYGTNSFPFMRGSEMLLTEAEAAYHNNQPGVATDLLKELNANRNSTYTCNKTGDALLEEIQLQRRIELWGEGFSWFDFKRWGKPLNRRAWVEGDVNSNNVPQTYALHKDPKDANGWRFAVPQSETQYNHAINRSELDY